MKRFVMFNTLLLFIFSIPNKVNAQNYSIRETILYINNLVVDKNHFIKYSNQVLTATHYHGPNLKFKTIKTINVKDVSDVTISDTYISVELNCLYEKNCSTNTLSSPSGSFEPRTNGSTRFYIELGDYDIAKKVSNALRYVIEKGKKEVVKNDPFATYSNTTDNKASTTINNLKIGMSKDDVFSKFRVKPSVESIESGYKIYKVNEDVKYFLYFSNDRLVRIDKGVRSPNTIIKIE